jgi:hypothetical protein
VDPLLSDISRRHCVDGLLDLCRLRFDFDIRQRLCRRATPINDSPSSIPFIGYFASPCEGGCANLFGSRRLHVSTRVELSNCPIGSKNRHDD